ncbi:MAG: ComEA family DNA-binding protein [Halioglobus sp.]
MKHLFSSEPSINHLNLRGWSLAFAALVLSLACSFMLSPAAFATVTGTPVSAATAENTPASQSTATRSAVNINTADAATLALNLRGVGQSRAQEIVRHREAYGPFASPEELMEVKGIGQSTLEQNRTRITLE